MQASTVILTNKSGTSTIQIPSVTTVRLEPTDDSVLVLSDSEDEICVAVDLSDTSSFSFRSRDSTPSKPPMDLPKSLYNLLYMRVAHHGSPSQHSPLHHFSSLVGMNIVDVLKQTKSRKISKSDLASINFDSIEVRDVKYLPSSFDGDFFCIAFSR